MERAQYQMTILSLLILLLLSLFLVGIVVRTDPVTFPLNVEVDILVKRSAFKKTRLPYT